MEMAYYHLNKSQILVDFKQTTKVEAQYFLTIHFTIDNSIFWIAPQIISKTSIFNILSLSLISEITIKTKITTIMVRAMTTKIHPIK